MSEDLHDYDEKNAADLKVGDIVQDLGMIEHIEKIDPIVTRNFRVDRYEVDMWSPSRGGTMRQWRADHKVTVRRVEE